MKPTIIIEVDVPGRNLLIKLISDQMARTEELSHSLIETKVFGQPVHGPLTKVDEFDRFELPDEGHVILLRGDFHERTTDARMIQLSFDVIQAALCIGFKSWAVESADKVADDLARTTSTA